MHKAIVSSIATHISVVPLKKCLKMLFFLLFSFFTCFIFLTLSPLHPWNGKNTYVDSSVFKTVALMMEKGYMPYKDSFDHKGPLIYIINFLGNKISYYRGVWIIELLFLMLTFLFLYKISRLFCSSFLSLFTTLVCFSGLISFFQEGNLSEEYALPFIAYSLFAFLDFIKNNNITRLRLLLVGLSFGAVLLLRVNMAGTWLIFCFSILLLSLYRKNYKQLLSFIFFFIIGCAAIIIPFVLWLQLNGALIDCWKVYIEFNLAYSQATMTSRLSSLLTYSTTTIFLICSLITIILLMQKEKYVNITYLIYLISSVIFIAISGWDPPHYGMVIIPAAAYPLANLFGTIENLSTKDLSLSLIAVFSVVLVIGTSEPWIQVLKAAPSMYSTRYEDKIPEYYRTIENIIVSRTDPNEPITSYGNFDFVYVISHRGHATQFSYQFPICYYDNSILPKYFIQLQDELPKLIIIQPGHYDNEIQAFINKNHYHEIWETSINYNPDEIVYVFER